MIGRLVIKEDRDESTTFTRKLLCGQDFASFNDWCVVGGMVR